MSYDAKTAVRALLALAHESRLGVFRLLIQQGPEGLPAGVIADHLDMQRPVASFHLRQLSQAGFQLGRAVRERWNFDTPEAFDWDLFVADLRALRAGEAIQRPIYDFTTHTRRPESEPVEPRPFLIIEGLLVLHHPDVRTLLDTTVFLEVDGPTAVDRRVARDLRERGRDPDSVRSQYAGNVQPMFERYVRPTARWATLTLSGIDPVEANVGLLVAFLTKR